MANIRVTPEELSAQGNDLISYAGELKEILDAVNVKIGDIIEGWDGLAQDAYYDMYTSMKTSLDQFPGLVDALGKATVSSADAFSHVDEELSSSFKSAL